VWCSSHRLQDTARRLAARRTTLLANGEAFAACPALPTDELNEPATKEHTTARCSSLSSTSVCTRSRRTNTSTPLIVPRPQIEPQGIFKYHQYQVVGRHNPTAAEPNPTVYRMKVWAPDAVCAKSKFW